MNGRPRIHGTYTVGEVDWQDSAACAGSDISWFFSAGKSDSKHKADNEKDLPGKYLCQECPVRVECLEYAIKKGEPYGVWGGLTTRERKKLKRERARYSELISTAGRNSSAADAPARD